MIRYDDVVIIYLLLFIYLFLIFFHEVLFITLHLNYVVSCYLRLICYVTFCARIIHKLRFRFLKAFVISLFHPNANSSSLTGSVSRLRQKITLLACGQLLY